MTKSSSAAWRSHAALLFQIYWPQMETGWLVTATVPLSVALTLLALALALLAVVLARLA